MRKPSAKASTSAKATTMAVRGLSARRGAGAGGAEGMADGLLGTCMAERHDLAKVFGQPRLRLDRSAR
jgi:hypothetical protein